MRVKPLFVEGDLTATLRAQRQKALRAVDEIRESEFTSVDPSELAAKLYDQFHVEPVALTEGAISVEAHDADIDRRKFRDIDHGIPGASPTLRGTRVIYNVPFTGDSTLFRLKPSRWVASFPYAVLTSSELRFVYEVPSTQADVAATRQSFEQDLALTKQMLGWVIDEVVRFNEELAAALERAVDERNARLAAAAEGLAALGLPVRKAEPARIDLARRRKGSATPRETEPSTGYYDVALSFAGEDRDYVEKVAASLREKGVRVFYDKFEAARLWGKDLVDYLQDVYQNRARFCVLFISQHYVNKPWPRHERRSAQARALVANEEYLLPARFDDTALPGLPPSIGFVDLRGLDPEDFAELILEKIGIAAE